MTVSSSISVSEGRLCGKGAWSVCWGGLGWVRCLARINFECFAREEAPRGTQERCVGGYSGEVFRVFRGYSGVFRGFQGYSGVFRRGIQGIQGVFRVFRPLILGFSAGNSGGTSPLEPQPSFEPPQTSFSSAAEPTLWYTVGLCTCG